MRHLTRRPLALALSLLLLSVLAAYGLGLAQMGGHAARGTHGTPLGFARTALRHLCAPRGDACAQASSGLMSATLLVTLVRPRTDIAALAGAEADDTSAQPGAHVAPLVPAALLGLVALAVACGWFAPALRRVAPPRYALALPAHRLPEHLCTPAP